MLSWEDLRCLGAIARRGSLAQAARDLGVDHSTLSRRLSALETTLGAKLFTRGASGLLATPLLGEILPLVEEMQRQADAIERAAAGESQQIAGVVRVTTSEALSGYFVQRAAALREQYPELQVDVLADNRSYDLLRGEADLAVRAREVTEPDLVARKLTQAGWALFANEAYLARRGKLASAQALAGHDLIAYDASMRGTPGGVWFETHGVGAHV
ncbi:MAG TPA: LysR family transcriptional regulator, partial [Polyangiales bacterium]|nr:LysR family transcriptional regulator [Polyangiales bacterium]